MPVTTDDEARFTAVFERHHRGVHALLLARTSDPEVARDLLQETFLRLWRRLDDTDGWGDGRLRGWLITVARNLVVDRYRAERTRRGTLEALERETPRPEARGRDAADHVVDRDELAQLERAIAELPDELREILTMTTVGQMTSQEVGEALGLPAGTVRYRLHRARGRLAEALEG
jgi:RNA polymerase sigma-70 factor, ECF subfamily